MDGEGGLFGELPSAGDSGLDSLFDSAGDDDENIFSALTQGQPDVYDIFGNGGGDSDDEE